VNLILDQNISFRVVTLLATTFKNLKQVRQLGLVDTSDAEIWSFAKKNNYAIITFDSDFIDLANLKGTPPKVIWLRFGNSSNLKIANKLISKADDINQFMENPQFAFLEIE
jgi:predicted nuclease of predicted toxin-antitoxin system